MGVSIRTTDFLLKIYSIYQIYQHHHPLSCQESRVCVIPQSSLWNIWSCLSTRIPVPWPPWPSTATQAPVELCILADCPPCIPSCTWPSLFSSRASGAVREQSRTPGPVYHLSMIWPVHLSTSAHCSPGSLPALSPYPGTSLECFLMVLCLPTQMAPSQEGHSQAPT